ncbi:MAG: hypothetical protein ACUVXH_04200 [Anaerolineae bacterium]
MARKRGIVLGIAFGALVLCVCAAAGGLGSGYFLWRWLWREGTAPGVALASPSSVHSPTPSATPSPTPSAPRPTATPTALFSTPSPTARPSLPSPPSPSTWEALLAAELPTRDLAELASRLRLRGTPIPTVVATTATQHKIGDVRTFWVANTDTHVHRELEAVLEVETAHVQMWVERGARVDLEGLRASAERFEAQTYPRCRETFGSEWTPGVDGDPHLLVLHAHGLGGVGGYFSAADEFSRLANPFSNEAELFYINLDYRQPGTEGYDSTLAHEFQHMIHWHQDRNEDSWVNEGLSMLAQRVSGFPVGNLHEVYLRQPDLQLTTWEDEDNAPHYGASYLLMEYFVDRYGARAVRLLVEEQANGTQGFDRALSRVGGQDFAAFFADWLVANLLDNPRVADGRYAYRSLDLPAPSVERLQVRPGEPVAGTVRPYGVDYLEVDPQQVGRVRFAGDPVARLAPALAHSGRFAWWSHRGDSSDARLTRPLDLSGLKQATLEFWLWYDLEPDYDYAYLSVSTDGGRSWTLLRGTHATDANPTGNNLGWGYNGLSGVPAGSKGEPIWVPEAVDLTPYAGREVWVRFEVVTDDAVNHSGLLLDDIRIPELGFLDDAEAGDGGWLAEGFVRMDNLVPQRWLLRAVVEGSQETRVEVVPVSADGQAEWVLAGLPPSARRVVLVVSALAPATTEPASYRLWVDPPPAETLR